MTKLNFNNIHPSWLPHFRIAFDKVDPGYIRNLESDTSWLPGPEAIFNAFSLPIDHTKYILFGESPYPRKESANGYAFWDASVQALWSDDGLSKAVNRATSLRNIMKMLLIAEDLLTNENTSQPAIAAVEKSGLVTTIDDLFKNFMAKGILLLNASLVLSQKQVRYDALAWQPFIQELLAQLAIVKPNIELILLGNIAKAINSLPSVKYFNQFQAEHPYNVSFIINKRVINFFKPFKLLHK